jgi:hypothetical protein
LGIYAYDHHSLLYFRLSTIYDTNNLLFYLCTPLSLIRFKPIKLWHNNNPQALLPMLKGEYKMCFETAMAESEMGI